MMEAQFPEILYGFSFVAMLMAFLSAYFHGDASLRKKPLSERLYEFCRNAFIQFSAMLFALATAEFVYVKTVDRQIMETRSQAQIKEQEQKKAQELSAVAIISDRATIIKRAMRRFEFQDKPGIMPSCLEEILPTEYDIVFKDYVLDDMCGTEVGNSIKSLIEKKTIIEEEMKSVVDSLKISEDWAKSGYFSGRMDPQVLRDFEAIEDKLDYRQFLIQVLIKKLDKINYGRAPQYEDVRYVSYIDLALRNFEKSSFVYLFNFYITFGDLSLSPEEIRKKEKKFINYVKSKTMEEKSMTLGTFRRSLESQVDSCEFEGTNCIKLIEHFEIDRSILTP